MSSDMEGEGFSPPADPGGTDEARDPMGDNERMELTLFPDNSPQILNQNGKRSYPGVDKENDSSAKKTVTAPGLQPASVVTTYTHPSLTGDLVRSYSEGDIGPYVVLVEREADNSATSFNPLKFGQLLFNLNIKNIKKDGIKKTGRNKMSVTFSNYCEANKFLINPLLKKKNTRPISLHMQYPEWAL